jgi:hypothetical protein
MQKRTIEKTESGFQLSALQDVPDLRDWPFEPTVNRLQRYIRPPSRLTILNQQQEGACTGFGLAAVINLLNQDRGQKTLVSARMLYEMARRHDEWPGEDYAGSSCRGAIKGWYNMGVCRDSKWKYIQNKPGSLTVKKAKDARKNTIGAYYRVQPRISDIHAALNEAGAVFCSARTHSGWQQPDPASHIIPIIADTAGGHAFALVGYNSKGFWIQNSWGRGWGKNGIAIWKYEDWHKNMMDAWVFNLALSTPQIWHIPGNSELNRSGFALKASPPRSEIAGHFVHVDDGDFHTQGRYWSSAGDVSTTAKQLVKKKKDYQHLLLYAHGGLNSPKSSATRIAAMKKTFKANGIYPYHFMYDTGVMEELGDIIFHRKESTEERAGGFPDWSDKILEWATRIPGRALWREMKRGARLPFEPERAGRQVLKIFLKELARDKNSKLKIHLVGHSTGGILLAHLLTAMADLAPTMRISSCSLLAPACTCDLFTSHYLPRLQVNAEEFGIDNMQLFNLKDSLEQDDQVGEVYRKSLLYLVSQGFEEEIPEEILGMEKYAENLNLDNIDPADRFTIHYSSGQSGSATASTTHGGFDNDVDTMNSILRTILTREPKTLFTEKTLSY